MTTSREQYLSVAMEFIKHGVPVFISPRLPDKAEAEFAHPTEWQLTESDENSILRWNSKYPAICAVTGVLFDVIDVDPRNGGSESFRNLMDTGLLTNDMVRWTVHTPSGGGHIYINRTGLRSLGSSKLLPGIDFKAGDALGKGRGFVYLPGTFRGKGGYFKGEKGYKGYEPQSEMEWDKLTGLCTNEDFIQFVLERQRKTWMGPAQGDGIYRGKVIDEEDEKILLDRAAKILVNIKGVPEGQRNDALNKIGFVLGGLVSGSGLNEAFITEATKKLSLQHLKLSEKEIEYHLYRSIAEGKLRPIDIWEEESTDDLLKLFKPRHTSGSG